LHHFKLSGVTEDQFKAFSEDSQSNIIHRQGVLISTRRTDEYKVLLYQIDGFYVEVFYHPTDHFIRIESFTGTEKLNPYLHQISIEDLA
jgi:hypothetical protein